MDLVFALWVCTATFAAASAPPYAGISQPAGGVVTQYLSGTFCDAASSATAGACAVTLNGPQGSVTSGVMNDVVNACSSFYGTACNGTADDTSALQAAINATPSFGALFISRSTKITGPLVLKSDITIFSNPDVSIRQATAGQSIFVATGTINAHLSDITIRGLRLVGSEATAATFAIHFNWVDDVRIEGNAFVNTHGFELDINKNNYNDVSTTTMMHNISVVNNTLTNTVEDGTYNHIVSYARDIVINNNVIRGGTPDGGGGGISVYGGTADPAASGAIGVPIDLTKVKCTNATVNGNTIVNQRAAVVVVQCQNVSVISNTGIAVGEALWTGASANINFVGNTISNSNNAPWQTQGIIQNVTFDNNVFYTSSSVRGVYVGSAYSTQNSPGPLRFTNNTVYSYLANAGSIYAIGDFTMTGNTFYNVFVAISDKNSQLDISDNKFIYDLFLPLSGNGPYPLLVAVFDSTMTASPNATSSYAKIDRNLFYDRTMAKTGIFPLYVQDSGATSTTSYIEIDGNIFKTSSTVTDIAIAPTISTYTALIANNKLAGKFDDTTYATAGLTKHVLFRNNYNLDGTNYGGALPTTQFYSTGSIILSNLPDANVGGYGWVNIAEGAPGTWVPITSQLPSPSFGGAIQTQMTSISSMTLTSLKANGTLWTNNVGSPSAPAVIVDYTQNGFFSDEGSGGGASHGMGVAIQGVEVSRWGGNGFFGLNTKNPATLFHMSSGTFTLDGNTAAFTTTGPVTASSFSGAGTNLTGTAASLTAGNVSGTVAINHGGTGQTTAAAAIAALLPVSTRQIFLSGVGATYTTPANARQLRIRMVGGGGGGSSSGTGTANGTAGSSSTFNSINAAGGLGGAAAGTNQGTPPIGAGSASFRSIGGQGGTGSATGDGGVGGGSLLGGGAASVQGNTTGKAASANTGGGGGGAGASALATGGGGSGGEYVELLINSPSASYTYTVGAGGAGDTSGSIANGGAGGAGVIIVDELY